MRGVGVGGNLSSCSCLVTRCLNWTPRSIQLPSKHSLGFCWAARPLRLVLPSGPAGQQQLLLPGPGREKRPPRCSQATSSPGCTCTHHTPRQTPSSTWAPHAPSLTGLFIPEHSATLGAAAGLRINRALFPVLPDVSGRLPPPPVSQFLGTGNSSPFFYFLFYNFTFRVQTDQSVPAPQLPTSSAGSHGPATGYLLSAPQDQVPDSRDGPWAPESAEITHPRQPGAGLPGLTPFISSQNCSEGSCPVPLPPPPPACGRADASLRGGPWDVMRPLLLGTESSTLSSPQPVASIP